MCYRNKLNFVYMYLHMDNCNLGRKVTSQLHKEIEHDMLECIIRSMEEYFSHIEENCDLQTKLLSRNITIRLTHDICNPRYKCDILCLVKHFHVFSISCQVTHRRFRTSC